MFFSAVVVREALMKHNRMELQLQLQHTQMDFHHVHRKQSQ